MNDTARVKQQFWALVLISALFFLGAPSVWHYTPDGGIYIGTAESIVETGQYRFNGYPNLQFYPGFSTLLSLPIKLFGVNFHILHLFCAAIVVASLWLTRIYFPYARYGLAGIAIPVLLACTGILQYQVFYILSDGTFLAVSLSALLLWRIYAEESHLWALIGCFLLVAFAPLVRFHGIFLCGAFASALVLQAIKKEKRSVRTVVIALAVGSATLIPFAAWTWRNFMQFTPDTFNMANSFFFGQKGLAIYSPEFGRVPWIDAEWKYPIYSIVYSVKKLGYSFFGHSGIEWVPTEILFIVFVGIAFIGCYPWFKLATDMERVYVAICVLFVLFWMGRSHSIYSNPRQMYLPFLPFILVSSCLGLHLIREQFIKKGFQSLYDVIIVFLFILFLSNGVSNFFTYCSHRKSNYYENASQVITEVKIFMDEKVSPGVPLATIDWGVVPFVLKRTCYQVLNDESHLLTLKRMKKYQTGYLIYLDDINAFPPYVRKMVKDFPQIFTLLLKAKPNIGKGPSAAVYKVDLNEVQLILDRLKDDQKIKKDNWRHTN